MIAFYLFTYWFLIYAAWRRATPVDVREQLAGIGSLSLWTCGSQGLNSGRQARLRLLHPLSHFVGPKIHFLMQTLKIPIITVVMSLTWRGRHFLTLIVICSRSIKRLGKQEKPRSLLSATLEELASASAVLGSFPKWWWWDTSGRLTNPATT